MLNLSENQRKALIALPVENSNRPGGTTVYTAASLNRLVELGLAEVKTVRGTVSWIPTTLGLTAQQELKKQARKQARELVGA